VQRVGTPSHVAATHGSIGRRQVRPESQRKGNCSYVRWFADPPPAKDDDDYTTGQYLSAFAAGHVGRLTKADQDKNSHTRDTMKTSFIKQLPLAVACAIALGLTSGSLQAQNSLPASERALVIDSTTSGSQVVRSGFGECWHSGFGPAPVSGPQCDPNYRAPVAQVAPPPAAVVIAPPPRPVVVAIAAPAPRAVTVQKVSLDADALFDFDKAVLRPEGRTMLDDFVSKLQGVDLEKIATIGHTDRFGSPVYNQSLSERRADAVKAYLVTKGVPSSRVQAEGKGEMQPVTKSGDCQGAKSAKVVACLQPDRRVDIDVIGSRTIQ
jgi:OOP family OmpA-OmpF porin